DLAATAGRFRTATEVKLYRFPRIPRLSLQTQTRRRLIAAMRHTIFATRITSHSIDHAVFFPVDVGKKLSVGAEMPGTVRANGVSHEIAWRFPSPHVAGGNSPRGAG